MFKFRFLALVPVLALVLMGASKCNVGGKPKNETCEVIARTTTTLTTKCVNEHGAETTYDYDVPSDLYPKCQVGTFWEGCKTA